MSKEIRVSQWLCMLPEACRIVGVTPLEFVTKRIRPLAEGMVLGAAWASMGPCGPHERCMLRTALDSLRKELKSIGGEEVSLIFPTSPATPDDVLAVICGPGEPVEYDGSIAALCRRPLKEWGEEVRVIRGLHGHFRGRDALAHYLEAVENDERDFERSLWDAGITPAEFATALEAWARLGRPDIPGLVGLGAVPAKFGAVLSEWVRLGRPAFSR